MNEVDTYKDIREKLDMATKPDGYKRDFSEAIKETGLTSAWLSSFVRGVAAEAGWMKVERVRAFLKKRGYFDKDTNNTPVNHNNNHPQGGNSMMSVKPPLSTPHRATNKTPSGAVSGIHSEGVGQ